MKHELSVNFVGPVKRFKKGRRDCLEVPAVLIATGVLCGSHGCMLYPNDELCKTASRWNNIKVTINHPRDSCGHPCSCEHESIDPNCIVGRVWNGKYQDGKLTATLYLWEDLLLNHYPEVLKKLYAGGLEVSTGIFTNDEPRSGSYMNRPYERIARDIKPDHLALLPFEKGACSWADGCGAGRWNSAFEEPLLLPGQVFNNQIDDAPLLLPGMVLRNQDNGPLLLPGF